MCQEKCGKGQDCFANNNVRNQFVADKLLLGFAPIDVMELTGVAEPEELLEYEYGT